MPNPFFAILLLFCIFCVLLCLSVLLNILYHYKACNNQSNYNNNEKNQRKSKIYHFKHVTKYQRPNSKKPDIALKNKILISNKQQNYSKHNVNNG